MKETKNDFSSFVHEILQAEEELKKSKEQALVEAQKIINAAHKHAETLINDNIAKARKEAETRCTELSKQTDRIMKEMDKDLKQNLQLLNQKKESLLKNQLKKILMELVPNWPLQK